ncbi:MAG: hypothetical protein D6798_10095 [Deltaproteobacteria bacterium]|nr:MAG: hypothetical protein D6798_10095 [Deltaproteobacteria bacterium]
MLLEPRDPHAGDELRMLPGDWRNHRAFAVTEKLDRPTWEELDARFRELYPAVLCGRADPSALCAVADRMGLTPPPRFDRRRARPAPRRVGDGLLADVCEDKLPDVGLFAPERVLGPFAELPLSRAARRVSGAVMAFSRVLPQGQRAIDRFYREKPRPDVEERAIVKCIERCPPMLWRPEAGGGLTPLLPLAAGFRLAGPVDGVPAAPAVVGRAVPLRGDGAWLACALPLPAVPDPAIIERRLTWELWRLRRHEMRLTWEDLLRERGELLTRTCLEWCWEAGATEAGSPWRWPEW